MSRKQKQLAVAILYMSLYQMGMVGISPVISDLHAAFPNAPALAAQTASTFPCLMMVLAALFAGTLSRRLGRRRTALLGTVLVLASGVGGVFCPASLPLLFCWSGILGLGISLFVPVVNSMMVDQYDDAQRSRLAGWQSAAVNVGGILLSLLAGVLATVHWSRAFGVFWGAIGGLVLGILFLPREHGNREVSTPAPEPTPAQRPGVPAYVWMCALVTFLFGVIYFIFSTNAALLLAERGIRSTTVSGLAVAFFMLGGCISGLLFGVLEGRLGRHMPAVSFVMLVVSYVVIYACPNLLVFLVAAALGGAGLCLIFPHMVFSLGNYVAPDSLVFATSMIISVSPNLGSFLSPFLFSTVTDQLGCGVSVRFLLGAGFAALLAILLEVVRPLERTGARCLARRAQSTD